uniref:DUF4203 domain-containing protein n=1 Tax=Panagrellus redivivus TaxID=6233 RepID=A0A7E4V0N9_PANRE
MARSYPFRRSYCCCGLMETRDAVLIIAIPYFICAIFLMLSTLQDPIWVIPLLTATFAVAGYIFDQHLGFFLLFVFELTQGAFFSALGLTICLTHFNHRVFKTVVPYVTKAADYIIKEYLQTHLDQKIPVNLETLLFWIVIVCLVLIVLHYGFAFVIADAYCTMRYNREKARDLHKPRPISVNTIDVSDTERLIDV